MSNTMIVPVSMPSNMAAMLDTRARRLAMTRSEYIRTLVRREVTATADDMVVARMLESAERDLKRGTARTLKPGGLSKMLKK